MSKKNRVKIRDASPGEQKDILDLTLLAYEEYAPLMPYWEYYKEDVIATLEDPRPADQIVAVRDGKIVGSVLLFPTGTVFSSPDEGAITLKWAEVRLLAVDPAVRRQGIGLTLMEECIRRARLNGGQFLTLHTNWLMSGAIRLYEQIGFVRYPDLDFIVDDEVVKGYRLDLKKPGERQDA